MAPKTVTVLHPLYAVARERALDGGMEYYIEAGFVAGNIEPEGASYTWSPLKSDAVLFANLAVAEAVAHASKAFVVVLTRDEDLKEWGRG